MRRILFVLCALLLITICGGSLAGAAGQEARPWDERVHGLVSAARNAAAGQAAASSVLVADNFDVLGHANLGGGVTNGYVWF